MERAYSPATGSASAQEAAAPRLVRVEPWRQHLQRDDAAELLIPRAVDDAHPPFAQTPEDREMREPLRRSVAAGARGRHRPLGCRRRGLEQIVRHARRRRVVAIPVFPRAGHGTVIVHPSGSTPRAQSPSISTPTSTSTPYPFTSTLTFRVASPPSTPYAFTSTT
jgi:hypothetical protein